MERKRDLVGRVQLLAGKRPSRFGRVSLNSSTSTFCCLGWEASRCCKLFAKTRQQTGIAVIVLPLSPNITVKD